MHFIATIWSEGNEPGGLLERSREEAASERKTRDPHPDVPSCDEAARRWLFSKGSLPLELAIGHGDYVPTFPKH